MFKDNRSVMVESGSLLVFVDATELSSIARMTSACFNFNEPRWDEGSSRKVVADISRVGIFLRLHQLTAVKPDRCKNGLQSKERHSTIRVTKRHNLSDTSLRKTRPDDVRIQIATRE